MKSIVIKLKSSVVFMIMSLRYTVILVRRRCRVDWFVDLDLWVLRSSRLQLLLVDMAKKFSSCIVNRES